MLSVVQGTVCYVGLVGQDSWRGWIPVTDVVNNLSTTKKPSVFPQPGSWTGAGAWGGVRATPHQFSLALKGLSCEQSCRCPWNCFWDVENKALGFWGLFYLEWDRVWVPLLWTHQPESTFFLITCSRISISSFTPDNHRLVFSIWKCQEAPTVLHFRGLNIPCTFSTKSSWTAARNGIWGSD